MDDISSANQTQETQMSGTPSIVTSLQHGDAGDETTESSKHWGRAFRNFCEKITFHGLRNITETTSHLSRRSVQFRSEPVLVAENDCFKEICPLSDTFSIPSTTRLFRIVCQHFQNLSVKKSTVYLKAKIRCPSVF